MASRKAVLDKNKQQLLDSVNLSNKIYNNEELSILLAEQQKKIDEVTKENTSLKQSISGLHESIAAISNPKQPIKATVFDVYDGRYNGGMFARDYNATPTEYKKAGGAIYSEFKQSANIGIPSGGQYSTLITINPYGSGSDFSGGYPTQIAITNQGMIYKRHSADATSWASWTTLHS